MGPATILTNDSTVDRKPGCPAWCAKDHLRFDPPGIPRAHLSATTEILPGPAESLQAMHVYAMTSDAWEWPRDHRVSIGGYVPPDEGINWRDRLPSLHLMRLDANDLATIIGMLAEATPDQLRRLAAGIRRCSALTKDTPGDRA
jgi:hypothetical protein